MKSFIAVAALAAGTNALVGRSDSCCFHITASGGASGSLGQLSDGQIRVGDNSLSPAKFCLAGGVITDSEGRNCVVTAETTQFQCDAGSAGTSGFSLSSSGSLEFNGSPNFVACATGQNNGDNIYTTESDSVTQCVKVSLMADSTCAAASSSSVASVAPSSSSSSMPVSTSVPSSSPAPSGSSPVGSSSSSAPAPVSPAPSSTPVVGSSSSLVTKTSSSAVASVSAGASTTASSASSASSSAGASSTPAAPNSASRYGLGNVGSVMIVLSMATLFFV